MASQHFYILFSITMCGHMVTFDPPIEFRGKDIARRRKAFEKRIHALLATQSKEKKK